MATNKFKGNGQKNGSWKAAFHERKPMYAGGRDKLKRNAHQKKKVLNKVFPAGGTVKVSLYMRTLGHPMKSEMEVIRSIIKNANPKVLEKVKWNAPSFFYKQDMAVFNPRAERFVQLTFLFPRGVVKDSTGLLLGDWKDRREARFYDIDDIKKKKAALERVVNEWVALMDTARPMQGSK